MQKNREGYGTREGVKTKAGRKTLGEDATGKIKSGEDSTVGREGGKHGEMWK